ncbi:hypothetical protein OHW55_03790 [Acinetobacter baumannii]|nr:hypothetical protein [Acinetobacter baumannii]
MGIKKNVVGVALVAAFALAASTGVFALTAADVNTATGASGAEETINAGYLWALGIAIVLFGGRKLIGMFGR